MKKLYFGLICWAIVAYGCKTTSPIEQEPTGDANSVRLLKRAGEIIKKLGHKGNIVEINRNKLMDVIEMNVESLNEYLRLAWVEIKIEPLTIRSTNKEIRKAYHALLKVFHPDKVPKNLSSDAHEIMLDIQKNYEQLIERLQERRMLRQRSGD